MSILNKCSRYDTAKLAAAEGGYPYFRKVSSQQDAEVIVDGRKMIMLGSNNYLGLTTHPRVKEAATNALQKFGTSSVGSSFLNGYMDIHAELEHELAQLVGKDDCIVFPTGYQANVGGISALVKRGEYVITDRLDHASILDGCRLSSGKLLRYTHNDMNSLEKVLSKVPAGSALIVTDGIFSMDGDIADLPNIVRLAKEYGAEIMIDDAHSVGIMGRNGAGTCDHFGLTDDVAIVMGTLSKALASIGGFLAASDDTIHYLKHHSRSLIFTTSLPPSSAASALESLRVIRDEPQCLESLWNNTRHLADGLTNAGFDIGTSVTPIIPVRVGPMSTTTQMWRELTAADIFVNPIFPPAVSPADTMIRCTVMSSHTTQQLDYVLETFAKVGKKLGIV